MSDAGEVLLAIYEQVKEASKAAAALGLPTDGWDLDAVFGLHTQVRACRCLGGGWKKL